MSRDQKRIQTYLNHLYELDYKERPVSVDQFLDDPTFLGKSTENGRAVYPVWRESLTELMLEDSKWLPIFTGAIGTGKTRAAGAYGLPYVMHRILCLKDPWVYFNLAGGGKLSIVFFNLTKTLGSSTSYQILQSHLLKSPWFLKHGTVRGMKDPYLDIPVFDYLLASPYAKGFGTLGHDVIAGIMDEVDSPNESDNQKNRVLEAYNNTSRRFTSRFVDPTSNETLGKLFIVSSKQETVSFLSTFIVEKQSSPEVYIKDISIWEAKAGSVLYSGVKFYVMVGDAYTGSKILDTPEDVLEAQRSEFRVIEIPVEYKDAFISDMIGSLRDLAGVSVESSRLSKLFTSEQMLDDCYDNTKQNPVKKSTIMVGLKDKADLTKYIDFSKIRVPRNYPRFIHCDIAYSGEGDALGLGMSCVSGWSKMNVELDDGNIETRKMPVVETDFTLRLKGKPGDQIDLSCVRRFVLDLRLLGFNIGKFTSDHRAMSTDTLQILNNAGIPTDYMSLDKTAENYLLYRDLVIERRWISHKDNYLHFELVNLDYDKIKNKVDHPDKVVKVVFLQDGDSKEVVLTGSKDKADGVVGSVVAALDEIQVPPDREIIRKFFNQIKQPLALKLPSSMNKPEIEFMREKGLGLIKENTILKSERASSTSAQTLRSIFKQINDG